MGALVSGEMDGKFPDYAMRKKSTIITLSILYKDFKERYIKLSSKDWSHHVGQYLSLIQDFSGTPFEERMVTGWLAALCERSYYVAAYRKSLQKRKSFEQEINKVLVSVSLSGFLNRPGPIICGKLQPSFRESVRSTLDRFSVLESLADALGPAVEAIVVGGSMSYVPFFGIRDRDNDHSDIDLLAVVGLNFFRKNNWKALIASGLFARIEMESFLGRIPHFRRLLQNDRADILSQRFSVPGWDFTVSMHFIPKPVFKKLVSTDIEKSFSEKRDMQYVIRDFRTDCFTHPCSARYSFDGSRYESEIVAVPVPSGGFISSMPGFTLSKGTFYPGVYQTVISPAFLVFYDRTGDTKKRVKVFRKVLYRLVMDVRKEFPLASYAKAHNRYHLFAPGRFDEGLNSFVSPDEAKRFVQVQRYLVHSIMDSELSVSIACAHSASLSSEENERSRNLVRAELDMWLRNTERKVVQDLTEFLSGKNFDSIISLLAQRQKKWYTVSVIPAYKSKLIVLSRPFKSDGYLPTTAAELHTVRVLPDDIMSLELYGRLSQVCRKVYIASVPGPVDSLHGLPVSYAIIIRVC